MHVVVKVMRSEHWNKNYFDKYLEMVVQAYSTFQNQVNNLLTRSIAVKVLKEVIAHHDAFMEVCNKFKTVLVADLPTACWTEESMTNQLERAFAQRQQELELFQRHREWAGELKALCRDMEGV